MRSRILRRLRVGVVIVAVGITVLAVLLVVAAWRNDRAIDGNRGVATAEVISAGQKRSAISFVTPDGVTRNPKLGVLYPSGLTVGQRIEVEYDRDDPDMVRVAGRDATVAVRPALSVAVGAQILAGLIYLVTSRFLGRRDSSDPETDPAGATDAAAERN